MLVDSDYFWDLCPHCKKMVKIEVQLPSSYSASASSAVLFKPTKKEEKKHKGDVTDFSS